MDSMLNKKWIAMLLTASVATLAVADPLGKFDLKPLRDPFWPVGDYPDNWQQDLSSDSGASVQMSPGWATAKSKIHVDGPVHMLSIKHISAPTRPLNI
jgi:hypothetical protein